MAVWLCVWEREEICLFVACVGGRRVVAQGVFGVWILINFETFDFGSLERVAVLDDSFIFVTKNWIRAVALIFYLTNWNWASFDFGEDFELWPLIVRVPTFFDWMNLTEACMWMIKIFVIRFNFSVILKHVYFTKNCIFIWCIFFNHLKMNQYFNCKTIVYITYKKN